MILDGWGIAADPKVSAIDLAQTPFIDSLYQNYPHTQLEASALAVGLPEGQMGNSEVGHMNLGAGRVVYQDLVKINLAVENGDFYKEPVLCNAFEKAAKSGKKLHLMGLVSDGGVHAHLNHLKALLNLAKSFGLEKVFVHAFTDGRDCDPNSGLGFIKEIEAHCEKTTGRVGSIIGRYYAMDRDKRWERVLKAYNLLVKGEGQRFDNVEAAISQSYAQGISDEFILPCVIGTEANIEAGDTVVCFNFRTDRGRQITQVLTQTDLPEFGMYKMLLDYITLSRYDDAFQNVEVVYEKDNLNETLGEVLSKNGKTQVRIAETEKYPHVTFFFSGGREVPFDGEKRIMCPSPKVATYDLQPEMAAFDIRDQIIEEIDNHLPDFVCLNFANPDMVGHTGNMQAAIRACETVDACAKAVVEKALDKGYHLIILADHGNADCMQNPDGSPNTAHTTQPVPCFVLSPLKTNFQLRPGVLGDVAPTLLHLMNIEKPAAMSGSSLIVI